ncbi:HAD family hydrolase [Leptolyngbya sp. NK1-12]|uniref:HAD family hydrolase n=2 Tax=Leptolyngbya sp. NK1-12 TaxID=2547451 RepID=A0AA96WPE3_9CYAN|nr:HAD family hydrolase [Leptolyngbya sp. NK1-12]
MFDIDGTLTQSNDLDNAAFLKALFEIFDFSEVSDDWTSYSHVTDACILKEICQHKLGRIPSRDEVTRFQKRLLELLAEGAANIGRIQPVLGASSILSKLLTSSNYRVAYAGGAWTASAIFKLQSANLPIQNIPYAFSDDDESREGITAIALSRAEQQYGCSFSSIVYVGDGVWDIRSARKSGYAFIGIASGDEAEILRNEGATYIFPDYNNTENFFAALTSAA